MPSQRTVLSSSSEGISIFELSAWRSRGSICTSETSTLICLSPVALLQSTSKVEDLDLVAGELLHAQLVFHGIFARAHELHPTRDALELILDALLEQLGPLGIS